MAAKKTVWVQAVGDYSDGGKVVLWEVDKRHPEGEIFIADANPVEVAETDAVLERIRTGAIVRVDAPDGEKKSAGRPKSEPKVDDK